MKFNIVYFLTLLLTLSLSNSIKCKVIAQITPDNTLGTESSKINSVDELRSRIEKGAIRGKNLFHSFQEFSIKEGMSVNFSNPEGVENIFSRVTGGSISEILGELAVDGDANLFFLNPNGIIFGENSILNVTASFLATTADNIEFDDGSQFSAVNPSESSLTIKIPVGLGFGSNSGAIQVNGKGRDFNSFPLELNESDSNNGLRIKPSNTLALIGGNVNFNGGIALAEKGRIEVGSIENGNVEIIYDQKGFVFDYKNVLSFSNINLLSQSFLNSSGEEGGSININGRLVNIADGSTLVIENRGIESISGNLFIKASDLIKFELKNLDMPFSGVLATQSVNFSDVGNIILDADQIVAGNGAIIYSSNFGNGISGNISVDSNELTIADNSIISTINFGNAIGGNIFVNSNNFTTTNNSFVASINFGNGIGGNVFVDSGNLTVLGGSNIGSANLGNGIGGDVSVLSNSINVNGIATLGLPVSTLSASTLSSGKAGNLSIQTSSLSISGGAEISSSTLGSGAGGTITINASDFVKVEGFSSVNEKPSQIIAGGNDVNLPQSLSFDFNSNIIIPSNPNQSLGTAGNVILNTPSLQILNDAIVGVLNQGTGNGGELSINADKIMLDNEGKISASTISGEGGNIALNSENLSLLNQSEITASSGEEGNGGNINIDSKTIFGLNNSDITANAVEGNGGNIRINTSGLFLFPDSTIEASSELGIDGKVEISTIENSLQQDLEPFELNLTTSKELFANSCFVKRTQNKGSFSITSSGYVLHQVGIDFYDSEIITSLDDSVIHSDSNEVLRISPQPLENMIPGNKIITTEDGRTLLVASSQLPSARSLMCN